LACGQSFRPPVICVDVCCLAIGKSHGWYCSQTYRTSFSELSLTYLGGVTASGIYGLSNSGEVGRCRPLRFGFYSPLITVISQLFIVTIFEPSSNVICISPALPNSQLLTLATVCL